MSITLNVFADGRSQVDQSAQFFDPPGPLLKEVMVTADKKNLVVKVSVRGGNTPADSCFLGESRGEKSHLTMYPEAGTSVIHPLHQPDDPNLKLLVSTLQKSRDQGGPSLTCFLVFSNASLQAAVGDKLFLLVSVMFGSTDDADPSVDPLHAVVKPFSLDDLFPPGVTARLGLPSP
ncbi:MAG: hypothetical protein ABL997_06320 [Planctomycetota bacterium]